MGIGTGLGYIALYIVLVENAGLEPLTAAIIGYLPAILGSYILCYRWVFRSQLGRIKTSLKFFTVNGSGYVLNTFGIFLLVDVLIVDYVFSQIITFSIVALHNYLFNFYWTFEQDKKNGIR